MLLIIMGLILFASIYVELKEKHIKEAEEEFCNNECRNYTKRYM